MNNIKKLALSSLVVVSSLTMQAEAKDFTLRMHHPGSPGHPYTQGADKFKQLVEDKTDGSITINIFPNNQLASGTKAIESVQLGTIDIALESTMTLSNFVPQIGVLNLPFLFKDRPTAYEVLDGDIGQELAKDAEQKGFKVLGYWDNGFRDISNSVEPINSPEDLNGLKIRVPESDVFISTFKALGAIPTPMAFSELFSALQLHTVDGQENPAGHLIEFNLYEVQKYFAITHHIYTAEPLLLSTDLYDQMSPQQQQALREAAKEAGTYERQLSGERADDYLAQVKEKGIAITRPEITAFQKAVEPVYAKYRDEYGSLLDRIREIEQ